MFLLPFFIAIFSFCTIIRVMETAQFFHTQWQTCSSQSSSQKNTNFPFQDELKCQGYIIPAFYLHIKRCSREQRAGVLIMQVAKYQNAITLFLARRTVKNSPSATLVHTQSQRPRLYKTYILPRRSTSPAGAKSQGKLNDSERGAEGCLHSPLKVPHCRILRPLASVPN